MVAPAPGCRSIRPEPLGVATGVGLIAGGLAFIGIAGMGLIVGFGVDNISVGLGIVITGSTTAGVGGGLMIMTEDSIVGCGVGSGVIILFVGVGVGTGFACTSSVTASTLNRMF